MEEHRKEIESRYQKIIFLGEFWLLGSFMISSSLHGDSVNLLLKMSGPGVKKSFFSGNFGFNRNFVAIYLLNGNHVNLTLKMSDLVKKSFFKKFRLL